jgi:peptidoglycan/LPS O-acetylase OafA/YrhL
VVCAIFLFSQVAVGITAAVAACISLYTIFLYKKRPLQANICRILCFVGVAFICFLAITHSGNYAQDTFIYPMIVTVLATLCWLFASRAILKDEKLVRSLDRIR